MTLAAAVMSLCSTLAYTTDIVIQCYNTIWYHELIEGKGNFCWHLIGRICVLKTLRSGIMPWYKTILQFVWWLLLIRKAFNIKRRRGLEFDLIKCEVFFAKAWMFVCCTYFHVTSLCHYVDQAKKLKQLIWTIILI